MNKRIDGVAASAPMHDAKRERERFEAAYAAIPPATPTKETAWRVWNMARAYGLSAAAGVLPEAVPRWCDFVSDERRKVLATPGVTPTRKPQRWWSEGAVHDHSEEPSTDGGKQ